MNRSDRDVNAAPPAARSARDAPSRPSDGVRDAPTPAARGPRGGPSPEARAALAWLHTARFLTTASQLHQLPDAMGPEIAFVGRSNAGKSTAINTLAQHKRLAFASRTPGRTQHINLFVVGPKDAPDAVLADLPGYGYAAVERAAKVRWQKVMADYLAERRFLTGVVLMIDSRLGLTEADLRLLQFIGADVQGGRVRLLVLLTKCDKLNRSERARALQAVHDALGDVAGADSDVGVALFSALSREGVDDVALALREWVDLDTAVATGDAGEAGEAAPAPAPLADAPVARPDARSTTAAPAAPQSGTGAAP